MKKLLTLALMAAAAFAAEGYKVLNKIKIGGTGGWDYVTYDPSSDRLYVVARQSGRGRGRPDAGKVVGQVTETPGVHGIAVAPELNKGFISSRGKNAAIVFDLKTLQKTGEAKAGNNPDAICYEPKTKRVVAVNHSGHDATIIDAKTDAVVGTVETGEARRILRGRRDREDVREYGRHERNRRDRRREAGRHAPRHDRARLQGTVRPRDRHEGQRAVRRLRRHEDNGGSSITRT